MLPVVAMFIVTIGADIGFIIILVTETLECVTQVSHCYTENVTFLMYKLELNYVHGHAGTTTM